MSSLINGSIAFFVVASMLVPSAAGSPQDLPPMDYEGKESLLSITPRMDVLCILRSWRLKGVMVCPTPSGGVNVCLRVENAWPTGLLEVVRQPMRSHLVEMKPILKGLKTLKSGVSRGTGNGKRSSSHSPVAGAGD